MKHLFIIILSVFILNNLKAQGIKLSFETGYGFYSMGTFSEITQTTSRQLPFEAKIISNYPPYHYYQPMVKFSFGYIDLGLIYSFQTTGSRISSKDYSGEYIFDSKINSNSPGIIFSGIIQEYERFKIELYIKAGVNFSALKMHEFLQLDAVKNDEDYEFTSSSIYCEPGITFAFPSNPLCLGINIGYQKEFLRDNFFMGQEMIPVKRDFTEFDMWDGFRLGVTVSYSIFKTYKEPNN